MSDQVSIECAGIQANIDNKKANPAKYELDLVSGADAYKIFPLNSSQPDEQLFSFGQKDNSSISELIVTTYISQSICRETRAGHPSRFWV